MHPTTRWFQESILQRHPSRRWGHCNKTSNWWPGFPRRWILAPQENTLWHTLIPPSLVQYDQKDYAQYRPQGLTTWTLPHLWCTFRPILSWDHLSRSISTPRRPLCWRFCVLFLISNIGGPIQDITPRTHPSQFHGRCWLFFRYCIYLDPSQRQEHIRSSIPVGIHRIHSPSVLGSGIY